MVAFSTDKSNNFSLLLQSPTPPFRQNAGEAEPRRDLFGLPRSLRPSQPGEGHENRRRRREGAAEAARRCFAGERWRMRRSDENWGVSGAVPLLQQADCAEFGCVHVQVVDLSLILLVFVFLLVIFVNDCLVRPFQFC